jgi:alpha-galactosidase
MREIAPFQGLGSFADMDMLEIGVGNFTREEQKTHFAFWAALKSPLIIGADLTKISNESLAILKNKDMIAISQDKLGKSALYLPDVSSEREWQVWAGPLSGGRTVILVLNEGASDSTGKAVWTGSLGDIPGLENGEHYVVQDVWSNSSVTTSNGQISFELAKYETKALIAWTKV